MDDGSAPAESGRFLAFTVAAAEYAVPLRQVREIIEAEVLTRVPGAPPWVRGVMSLRGGVLPVVDLAAKLGLAAAAETGAAWSTGRTCVLVVEVDLGYGETAMGALVDGMRDLLEFDSRQIGPPDAVRNPGPQFVLGVYAAGERSVPILDLARILAADDVVAAGTERETPESLTPEAAGGSRGQVEGETGKRPRVAGRARSRPRGRGGPKQPGRS